MSEVWRRVRGFDRYEVSDLGRVRNADTGRVLSPGTARWGKLVVGLYRKKQRHWRYVHRLIIESFRGPPPDGHECNHINGNGQDNRLSNLEWLTPTENNRHAIRLGLRDIAKGERVARAKLNEVAVNVIRYLAQHGVSSYKLARSYSVSRQAINKVVSRRTWKHIPDPRITKIEEEG